MKLIADKCHLLILGRKSNQQVILNIGDYVIENTAEEKLLVVVIDKKLAFDTYQAASISIHFYTQTVQFSIALSVLQFKNIAWLPS